MKTSESLDLFNIISQISTFIEQLINWLAYFFSFTLLSSATLCWFIGKDFIGKQWRLWRFRCRSANFDIFHWLPLITRIISLTLTIIRKVQAPGFLVFNQIYPHITYKVRYTFAIISLQHIMITTLLIKDFKSTTVYKVQPKFKNYLIVASQKQYVKIAVFMKYKISKKESVIFGINIARVICFNNLKLKLCSW